MPLFSGAVQIGPEQCNAKTLLSIDILRRTSQEFCKLPVRKLSVCDKTLYVTQREYATVPVGDDMINFIGSQDATTCHIMIMRSEYAVSVGHFDGSDTQNGVKGMVEEIKRQSNRRTSGATDENTIAIVVHLFGGFLDDRNISTKLLTELLTTLQQLSQTVNIRTACVDHINNESVNRRNQPIIYGVAIDLRNGDIFPATFSDKGPGEILKHAKMFGDCKKMFDIYNSDNRSIIIGPYPYKTPYFAPAVLSLKDDQILEYFSTSPHCEPDDFVQATRKVFEFLIEQPDSTAIFKDGKPLIYQMDSTGVWH